MSFEGVVLTLEQEVELGSDRSRPKAPQRKNRGVSPPFRDIHLSYLQQNVPRPNSRLLSGTALRHPSDEVAALWINRRKDSPQAVVLVGRWRITFRPHVGYPTLAVDNQI